MDCREARELLEEYRRRELPAEAAGLVEAHLRGCRDCPRILEGVESLAGMIRALPRTPAPASLVRTVRSLARPRRGMRTWLARPWVAATVSAVLVALALSPFLRLERTRTDVLETLLQSGVAEHRRIVVLAEGTRDVDDPSPLFREVERLTGITLPAIFAGVGELHLRDARATVLAGRKSAAAALRYPKSPITTYFVLYGADLPMPPAERRVQIEQFRPYMREMNGYNVVYWKQKDLAYVMVSGLDKEGCQKLFLKMRKAL